MTTKPMLTGFQVVATTSMSFFPLTFWIFPRIAVDSADLDAQWSVLGILIIGVLTGYLQGIINHRFQTVTGADMLFQTFGNWFGRLLGVGYAGIYIFFVGTCVYFFVITMQGFFPNTPKFILILIIFLVAMRGAWHGIVSLGRVSSFVHPMTLLGLVSVLIFLLLQLHRVWMPYTVTHWSDTVKGIYMLFPLFLGINLSLMLSPYYDHTSRRSIWFPAISAIIGGFVIILTFFSVILNTGWEAAKLISFSVPFVISLVRIQGWLVERLGVLIIILVTAYTILFVALHIWATSMLGARILGMNKKWSYRYLIVPMAVMMGSISLWFHSDQQAFELVETYLVPLSWVFLLFGPLVILLVAILRGVPKKT